MSSPKSAPFHAGTLPPPECDNYLPPSTCQTAPSSETGRCDKCLARVTSTGGGRESGSSR